MRRGAEEEAMLSLNFSKFVSLHCTFESCIVIIKIRVQYSDREDNAVGTLVSNVTMHFNVVARR